MTKPSVRIRDIMRAGCLVRPAGPGPEPGRLCPLVLIPIIPIIFALLLAAAPVSYAAPSKAEAPPPSDSAQAGAPPAPAPSHASSSAGAGAEAPSPVLSPPRAAPVTPTIGETFAGERLTYEIGFWFFEKVAEAELTLTREKGGYRAVLRAWTTGFVDKVIQHRSDVYTAHLVEVEGGARFATLSLESSSNVNGKVRRSIKKVDRRAGTLYRRSWGGGKEEKKKVVRFTPGTFIDDPLGGFYNFRFGVYGRPGQKKDFAIRTFPKNDHEDAFIRMKIEQYGKGAKDPAAGQKKTGTPAEPPAYLARVMMSKEVFGTDLSDIDIYFSADLVPLRAEARDLVLFTDVRGTLKNRTASDEKRDKKDK